MDEYLIRGETLAGIADAIRAKAGTTDTLTPDDIVTAIQGIQAGGAEPPAVGMVPTAWSIDGYITKADIYGTHIPRLMAVSREMDSEVYDKQIAPFGALEEINFKGKVISIGDHAFSYCGIRKLIIPASLRYLYKQAFADCYNLTEVVFLGTPSFVDSEAFNCCYNLTTIKVPWAEGEVANAPWGTFEENPTIIYNYTGEV